MKIVLAVVIASTLISCANLPLQPTTKSNVASGALGAAGVVAANKIREVVTPNYPIHRYPLGTCAFDGENSVTCVIIPCKKNCSYTVSLDEFIAANPIVAILDLSSRQHAAILYKCKKDVDRCLEFVAQFEGTTVLIKEKR